MCRYKVEGHPSSTFGVNAVKDNYTKCESGSCFFIDFHFDLGGETLASRTALGNPDNDQVTGMERGTFFVYDPDITVQTTSGGGNNMKQSRASEAAPRVAMVALALALASLVRLT